MDITVEPELYSTTVLVFSGATPCSRRLSALLNYMSVTHFDSCIAWFLRFIPGMALTLFAGLIVIIFA